MLKTMPRKISAVSLLLAMLCLISWQYWILTDTHNTLRQQKMDDMHLLLERTADYLNLYAEGLNSALLNLADALEVIGHDAEQLGQALTAFRASNPGKILSATFMVSSGEAYSTKQAAFDVFGSKPLADLYAEVNASRYRGIRWTEPYTSSLALMETVALYKPVSWQGASAVLVIEINLHTMLSNLLHVDRASSTSWTVVSDGLAIVSTSSDYSTLVPSDQRQLSRAAIGAEIVPLLANGASVFSMEYDDAEYITMQKTPICFDWHLLAVVRAGDLYATTTPMVQRTFMVGMLHMLILVVLIMLLSQRLMRPLTAIARDLQQAADPLELSFDRYAGRRDEVGVLARSLAIMIGNLKAMIAQQEELQAQKHHLELTVLQGQIHPHFLGNTLTCIASLAKAHAYDAVQESLHALIRLMNYSIARTDAMVTLQEELACVEAYVALRQIRMDTPFAYHASVAGHHLRHMVPRLFLQPIIENAIVHGISRADGGGEITVTSYEHHGKLFLCVDNSGEAASQARLDMAAHGEVEPSPHAHGIGVNNVFQRLYLTCDGSTACRLEARGQGGVRAILDLGKKA